MSRFFTVLKFEFSKTIKSKPFRILTGLMVVMIAIMLSFPMLKEMFASDDKPSAPADDIKKIGVVNNSLYSDETLTAMFGGAFADYEVETAKLSTDEAKELVKEEEYKFVVILDDEKSYTVITQPVGINDSTMYTVDAVLVNNYKSYLLSEKGLSPQEAGEVLGAQLDSEVIETGKNQGTSFLYTYVLVFGLYMVIIIYGQLVATSVASEKSSRAMEVLITTISPVRMMFGKVIGTGLAALCQLAAVIGAGVIFYNINIDYWASNQLLMTIFNIPTDTIVISVILLVLGFFVYAFLYAAVGSLSSRAEDINTSILPITFISMASFMLVFYSMMSNNTNSTLMKICSWFPLTSPFALLMRASMTDLSFIESAGAIATLLVTCAIIGYIAAAIYKMGVLLYGKPPKLSEIFKLIRKKDSV